MRRSILLAALGVCVSLWAGSVRADLVISAPSFSAAPGSSGTFDVVITDTDPAGSAAYHLNADGVEVGVTGSGVAFTDSDFTTAHTYVFDDSFDKAFGFTIDASGIPYPKTDATATDLEQDTTEFRAINPGDTFGLVQLSYSIDANAVPGDYSLQIERPGVGTSLADPSSALIPFTGSDGTLTVLPEPATIGLMLFAEILLMRRRKALEA